MPFTLDPTTGALFSRRPPPTGTETDMAAAMADVSDRGQSPTMQQRSAKKGGPPKRNDYVSPDEWLEAVRKWRTEQDDNPAGSTIPTPTQTAGRRRALGRMK